MLGPDLPHLDRILVKLLKIWSKCGISGPNADLVTSADATLDLAAFGPDLAVFGPDLAAFGPDFNEVGLQTQE